MLCLTHKKLNRLASDANAALDADALSKHGAAVTLTPDIAVPVEIDKVSAIAKRRVANVLRGISSMSTFSVVIDGLKSGAHTDQTVDAIAKLSGLPESKVRDILAEAPTVVKKELDRVDAEEWQRLLLATGAAVSLRPSKSQLPFDVEQIHGAESKQSTSSAESIHTEVKRTTGQSATEISSWTFGEKTVLVVMSLAILGGGLLLYANERGWIELGKASNERSAAPAVVAQRSAGPILPAGTTICIDQRNLMRHIATREHPLIPTPDGCIVLGADTSVRILRQSSFGAYDITLVGNAGGSGWVATDEIRQ